MFILPVIVGRDGDRSQDTDDSNDNHQFNEGETFLIFHFFSDFFGLEEVSFTGALAGAFPPILRPAVAI